MCYDSIFKYLNYQNQKWMLFNLYFFKIWELNNLFTLQRAVYFGLFKIEKRYREARISGNRSNVIFVDKTSYANIRCAREECLLLVR